MTKLMKIEVCGSLEAAEATKKLMVTNLGFKDKDVAITDSQRLKISSQGVTATPLNAFEATFEDLTDSKLHVVIGTK